MKRFTLLLLWLPLLTVGCSKRVRVQYDSTVSPTEQQYLEGDLDKIAALDIPDNPNSNEASLMGLSNFSAGSLNGWLSDRTQYIVGENYNTDSAVATIASGISYTPQLFGETGFIAIAHALGLPEPGRLGDSSSSVQTVMTNVGAAVYLQGKQNSVLYSMSVAGQQLTVNSPRVNVEQIGPGLFQSKTLQDSPIDSMANACLRGSTIYHEGGHSNGNGKNAGFPHAMCNSGSYSGYYACENNLNGPYVIGRVFLTQCYYACAKQGCTPQELDELTTFIADLVSRVQPGAVMSDPTPEKENL